MISSLSRLMSAIRQLEGRVEAIELTVFPVKWEDVSVISCTSPVRLSSVIHAFNAGRSIILSIASAVAWEDETAITPISSNWGTLSGLLTLEKIVSMPNSFLKTPKWFAA